MEADAWAKALDEIERRVRATQAALVRANVETAAIAVMIENLRRAHEQKDET